METRTIDLRHPSYKAMKASWRKWRLTYASGDKYIEEFVKKFSTSEDEQEFRDRKSITYIPAFAKGAINEIKNSIFQRTTDITREGGPSSYQVAIEGKNNGVDLMGSSMNTFIGREILPELLTMGKVGVFIDMPIVDSGEVTKAETQNLHPYIYKYVAEDILSWSLARHEDTYIFTSLLLRDHTETKDQETGLIKDIEDRYRLLNIVDSHIEIKFYNKDNEQIDIDGTASDESYTINLPSIPFIIFELNDSLLKDVANHQISLVNLASSDISYAVRSNFPFYTEQYDPRLELYSRPAAGVPANDGTVATPGTATEAAKAKSKTVKVGNASGRRYPKDLERPGFIHPSSEPLIASIAKQKQLKEEIRHLVALAVTNLEPKSASAESKEQDQQGLEAGLSYIGLELENGERLIAKYWNMYLGEGTDVTIKYPARYHLLSDKEKREEAKDLEKLLHSVPSSIYRKEMVKEIVKITVGHKVSAEKLETILNEVESSTVINTNPEIIIKDIEAGLVDAETASLARGYPKGSVKKAKVEHAERLARIQASQAHDGGARGNPDNDDTPGRTGSKEKQQSRDTNEDSRYRDKTRGRGR